MTNPRFEHLTALTAPEASRPLVAASGKRFGFVPSPIGKAARSPATLAHSLAGFAAFERSSLSAVEREVVAMTVATRNGCEYCVAMHSALLSKDAAAAPLVGALREGAPLPDARLEALRRFTRAVHEGSGRVDRETWEAFRAAGYDETTALDVVLGVGVYVLSTTMNILVDAEVDPPFAAFAWSPAAAR